MSRFDIYQRYRFIQYFHPAAHHGSLKPYLQQRLLRIPGGRRAVQEEEEVDGQAHHRQKSRQSPIFREKIYINRCRRVLRAMEKIFGDQVDLPHHPCNFAT